MKAGLPPDSWLAKDVKVFKFSAIIFEEQTSSGGVKRLKF
jgi:AMMECR1 domain-containing protein